MIAFLCLPTFLHKWKLIFNVSIICREGFKDCDLFAQIQCLPHKYLSADCSHEMLAFQGRVFSHSSAAQGMNQHQVNKHLPSGHISCDPPEHLMQEPWHTVIVWLYNYKAPHHKDFLKQ